MAAATMNRSGFPPISYHTPQSNSPASVQSPQHDQHGRPIYGQPPSQMPQSMYYTPYASSAVPQQSPYPQHPSSAPQQPMASNSLLMSHQQGQQMQHPHQPHPHTPEAQSRVCHKHPFRGHHLVLAHRKLLLRDLQWVRLTCMLVPPAAPM
jgi:hypothetical protein